MYIKKNLRHINWDQFDNINHLITLYMIPLSGTYCNAKIDLLCTKAV